MWMRWDIRTSHQYVTHHGRGGVERRASVHRKRHRGGRRNANMAHMLQGTFGVMCVGIRCSTNPSRGWTCLELALNTPACLPISCQD